MKNLSQIETAVSAAAAARAAAARPIILKIANEYVSTSLYSKKTNAKDWFANLSKGLPKPPTKLVKIVINCSTKSQPCPILLELKNWNGILSWGGFLYDVFSTYNRRIENRYEELTGIKIDSTSDALEINLSIPRNEINLFRRSSITSYYLIRWADVLTYPFFSQRESNEKKKNECVF